METKKLTITLVVIFTAFLTNIKYSIAKNSWDELVAEYLRPLIESGKGVLDNGEIILGNSGQMIQCEIDNKFGTVKAGPYAYEHIYFLGMNKKIVELPETATLEDYYTLFDNALERVPLFKELFRSYWNNISNKSDLSKPEIWQEISSNEDVKLPTLNDIEMLLTFPPACSINVDGELRPNKKNVVIRKIRQNGSQGGILIYTYDPKLFKESGKKVSQLEPFLIYLHEFLRIFWSDADHIFEAASFLMSEEFLSKANDDTGQPVYSMPDIEVGRQLSLRGVPKRFLRTKTENEEIKLIASMYDPLIDEMWESFPKGEGISNKDIKLIVSLHIHTGSKQSDDMRKLEKILFRDAKYPYSDKIPLYQESFEKLKMLAVNVDAAIGLFKSKTWIYQSSEIDKFNRLKETVEDIISTVGGYIAILTFQNQFSSDEQNLEQYSKDYEALFQNALNYNEQQIIALVSLSERVALIDRRVITADNDLFNREGGKKQKYDCLKIDFSHLIYLKEQSHIRALREDADYLFKKINQAIDMEKRWSDSDFDNQIQKLMPRRSNPNFLLYSEAETIENILMLQRVSWTSNNSQKKEVEEGVAFAKSMIPELKGRLEQLKALANSIGYSQENTNSRRQKVAESIASLSYTIRKLEEKVADLESGKRKK